MPDASRRAMPLALLLLLASTGSASAQFVVDRPVLTHEGAKIVAAAAEAEAVRNGWEVVIVVTDPAGELLHLQRMDGAQLGSMQIAQAKARTSARYRRPSKSFADGLANGSMTALVLPDVIPLEGGLPIVVGDRVIGAVGVSGVRSSEDAQIAQAGIDALLAKLKE